MTAIFIHFTYSEIIAKFALGLSERLYVEEIVHSADLSGDDDDDAGDCAAASSP